MSCSSYLVFAVNKRTNKRLISQVSQHSGEEDEEISFIQTSYQVPLTDLGTG